MGVCSIPRGTVLVEHSATFNADHRALLEQIATGAPLPGILDAVVRFIERQAEGMICSILLIDHARGCVRPAAAPSLPEAYSRALDGVAIGPDAGSCGTAAWRGERVIVEDIAAHPYWSRFRDLALPHGLRACWSSPIFASDGRVLGTFAMYYRVPRGPTEIELSWVDVATHLAAIALARDEARERLIEGERRRAFIFNNVAEALFNLAVEPDGRFRFVAVNPAFCRATGLVESDVVGHTVDEVIPEPSRALVLSKYQEAIARGAPVSWEEVTPYPSGLCYGEVTVAPFVDADGRCTNLIGTVHDVTARRRAEIERHELEARFHHAQRNQALGTLSAGIAHDFNNMVAAMLMNTEVALAPATDPAAVRENLVEIRVAGRRAQELVRRILDFSRSQEPRRSVIALADVVDEALRLLRATLPATLTLTTRFAPDTPKVLADATQIHQVLVNLGMNAAQATPDRSGSVAFELDGVTDDEGAPGAPPRRYARLRVLDRGVGMDPATVDRLFEPYFTTRREQRGTGLGLWVVAGIVQNHGGTISVDSAPGRGTTFTLRFPAA